MNDVSFYQFSTCSFLQQICLPTPRDPAPVDRAGRVRKPRVRKRRVKAAGQERKPYKKRRAMTEPIKCKSCGEVRDLSTGHSQHRGTRYCPKSTGLSKEDWLAKRQNKIASAIPKIPTTTAFHRRKREEADRALVREGKSPKRHYQARTQPMKCKACGEAKSKMTGHSQYKGSWYCPNTMKISKKAWLAQRSGS